MPADDLRIVYQPSKRGAAPEVAVKRGETVVHAARLDVCDSAARQTFAATVAQHWPEADPATIAAAVQQELLNCVADAGERGDSQATALVKMAADVELFHAPGVDGDTFARVMVDGHVENVRVASRRFRAWLAERYWAQYQRAPGSQALQDALNVLTGRAMHDGIELPVHVRIAEHDGNFYIDLADPNWRAVEITAVGWRVVKEPPVRFIRPRGVLPLPEPVHGGNVQELRGFVNVGDENDWVLILAWLVAAVRPRGPYPLLVVNGEQGSAKSTLCRVLRALIDPNVCAIRSEPREPRDLMIAATNGWALALDNLSHVSPWLSDALCRLATGGGFATRELYSDSEEKLFEAQRPVLLNGIEDLATRPDLLDRAICVTLPTIPEHHRRTEAMLWGAFRRVHARILGGLLDVIASAMASAENVRLPSLPRMADFAVWATAAEPALGQAPGTFIRAYIGNVANANELAVEASVIGAAVQALAAECGTWTGTATELLAALDARAGEQARARKEWPKNGRKVSGELRRIAPNLRRLGVNVSFGRQPQSGRRNIRLEQMAGTPSPPSPPSPSQFSHPPDGLRGDDGDGRGGAGDDAQLLLAAHGDGGDGPCAHCSDHRSTQP